MIRRPQETMVLNAIASQLPTTGEEEKWLFPLYPEGYQQFCMKRTSKKCVGEHSLLLLEMEGDLYQEDVSWEEGSKRSGDSLRPEDISNIKYVVEREMYQEVSMMIYYLHLDGDKLTIHMQTYGGSSDCDSICPTFLWSDDLGLYVCYNSEYAEPMVVSFKHYTDI